MSYTKIIQYPNEKLRRISSPINKTDDYKTIVSKLRKSLYMSKKEGIGLSAPQIGINKRIFIAKRVILEGKKEKFVDVIFINPEIVNKSSNKINSLEGCLSIENVYGYVQRAKSLKLKYLDEDFKPRLLNTGGYLSLVIQHEQDHLDGILFIDKLVDKKSYTEKEIDLKIEQENSKI